MIENAYNVSVRAMFDIPRTIHRNLIEAISGTPHIRSVLMGRFLGFIEQLKKCPKKIVGNLLSIVKHDVRSVTGSNLRKIMQICEKDSIRDLNPIDAKSIRYHPLPEDQEWKAGMIRKLIDVKAGNASIAGFSQDDLDFNIHDLCTS